MSKQTRSSNSTPFKGKKSMVWMKKLSQSSSDQITGEKKEEEEKVSLKYTKHGETRKKQREISQESIQETILNGEKLGHGKSVTYIDEDNIIVLGENQQVITVMENKRNTQNDLLRNTKDREQELIKKASFKNNDYAMCELGEFYLNRNLGIQDIQKAYDWFIKAAKKYNSHAMCKIAQIYEEGSLGFRDKEAALEWMEKAANHNNKYALSIIGQRLLAKYKSTSTQELSKEDRGEILKKAMSFFEYGASKGATRSMWHLAHIYEHGLLGKINLPKAISIYTKAAKLGSPNSLASLNALVIKGEFDTKEFENILDKTCKLLSKTSISLAVDIGLEQIEGTLGSNPKRGWVMLEKAANKQNEEALIALMKLYKEGRFCEPNIELSIHYASLLKELYEKALSQGNFEVLWSLGKLFLKGRLGKIDLEQAEKLFIQATEAEDIIDIYNLGLLYIEGCLGDKDPKEGHRWIQKAISMWVEQASAGDSEAASNLGDLYLDEDLGYKNYQLAFKYLTIAAEIGNVEAMILLANLYLEKQYGYRSIKKSIKWVEKISEQIDSGEIEEESVKLLDKLSVKENLPETFSWFIKKALGNRTLEESLQYKGFIKYTFFQTCLFYSLAKISLLEEPPNYIQAAKYYSLLARNGHISALLKIGKMFQNKYLDINDHNEQLSLFKELTENLSLKEILHTEDALILGRWYKSGNILPKNLGKAVKYFSLAADLSSYKIDSSNAVQELETLLNLREGTVKEKKQIIQAMLDLELKTDKSSHLKVITRVIGDIYNDGILTPRNVKKAIIWFKKSADINNLKAMCKLGNIYEEIDIIKAIEYYILAASGNNEEAITTLKHFSKLVNLEPSLKAKINLWQREYEISIEKEFLENIKPKSMNSKNPDDLYKIGKQYLNGAKVEQDYLQAALYFRKAAKKDHADATFELASMYESGKLGKKVCLIANVLYKDALKSYELRLNDLEDQSYPPNSKIIQILEKIELVYSKLGKVKEKVECREQIYKLQQEHEQQLYENDENITHFEDLLLLGEQLPL